MDLNSDGAQGAIEGIAANEPFEICRLGGGNSLFFPNREASQVETAAEEKKVGTSPR